MKNNFSTDVRRLFCVDVGLEKVPFDTVEVPGPDKPDSFYGGNHLLRFLTQPWRKLLPDLTLTFGDLSLP